MTTPHDLTKTKSAISSEALDADCLSEQTETVREKALERFRVIRPFLEDSVSLITLAQQHNISPRTIQRWVEQYQEGGLAALCRKGRADKGKRRVLSSELVELVEALALQTPQLSGAAIWRKITEIAIEHKMQAPSYDLVYDIIQQIDPALVTLAHDGSKVYEQTFELLYRREAQAPNAIWQADHTPLDILLQDDKGEASKPWLTVVQDDYSRAVAGYMLTFETPTALHTALALHQAIWRKAEPNWQICGIPEVLYTDHGSDFTSHHIEQVCADLKIHLIFSQVGKPRGRGRIERFFNTVNQMFLSTLPGYAPAGFADKVKPVLDLNGLDREFQRFILDDYHQRVHSATGISPQKRWHANGFLPQMPASLEDLDLLLLTIAKSRVVQRDGIRFQGLRYIDSTLADYIGESVIIRYDPRDITEIRIYHRNRFLCRAVCQELAGETVSLKDIIRARKQRKRELKRQLSERRSLVDQLIDSSVPPSATQDSDYAPPTPKPKPKHNTLKRYQNE